MACAEAELTGVPGVVVVGNGPGLASVVNGVAHAWLDRVPLLVISDRYTEDELSTTGHQILDQRALLAPVVKWSVTVDASVSVERALDVALDRPVWPGPPRHAAHGGRRRSPASTLSPAAHTRLTARGRRPSPAPAPPPARARLSPRPSLAASGRRPLRRHQTVHRSRASKPRAPLRRRPRGARRAARRARPHHVQGQGRARRGASTVGRDRDRWGDRGAAARRGGRDPRGRARSRRAAHEAVAVRAPLAVRADGRGCAPRGRVRLAAAARRRSPTAAATSRAPARSAPP